MQTLRQRIRKTGIRCIPWRLWRGEIELLPISAQTLFKREGLSIDLWEIEIGPECDGYLLPGESLLEVLKYEKNLYRKPFESADNYDPTLGGYPDDWDEEDYIYHEEQRKNAYL